MAYVDADDCVFNEIWAHWNAVAHVRSYANAKNTRTEREFETDVIDAVDVVFPSTQRKLHV